MLKVVFFFITVASILMHPTYSSPMSSYPGAFFHPDRGQKISRYHRLRFQIEQNFALKRSLSDFDLYAIADRALNEANPKHDGLSANQVIQLTRDVVQTSQCYGVDPLVFTALVSRESAFKPAAVSERGAVGLTQMTQTGVREVLDRVNTQSPRRLGYLRALVKRCNPKIYKRLPDEVSDDLVFEWKTAAAKSTLDSLVLGALLLKINLASTPVLGYPNDWYETALEHYNGDPLVKEKFAADVLTLSKRLEHLPRVALNEPKFRALIASF